MTDLLCTELSPLPAVCSPLQEDQRRLQILIEQEDRFMPSYHRLHNAGHLSVAEDGDRTRMLEIMHEVRYLLLMLCACMHAQIASCGSGALSKRLCF